MEDIKTAGGERDSARSEPQLEHERLEVYHLGLKLHAEACGLLPRRENRTIRDQLERASLSIVLNIAEGAGRRSSRDKRRFYEIARGSTTETAAIIDVISARNLAPQAQCVEVRRLAVRVVQMLSRLVGPAR